MFLIALLIFSILLTVADNPKKGALNHFNNIFIFFNIS